MAWLYGEHPPSYLEAVQNNVQSTPVVVEITTVKLYRMRSNVATGVLEQARISEARQNVVTNQLEERQETSNRHTVSEATCYATGTRSECRQNTFNHTIVGTFNASNSFKGLLDILYKEKKLPWGFAKNTVYKLGLFICKFSILHCRSGSTNRQFCLSHNVFAHLHNRCSL